MLSILSVTQLSKDGWIEVSTPKTFRKTKADVAGKGTDGFRSLEYSGPTG